MASTPIYENPNGRKRRKGYSTEVRNKMLEAKEYYNINSPDFKFNIVEHMMLRTTSYTDGIDSPWKNINPNVKLTSHNLPDGRVEASSKIPFDRAEIESYIEETAKALQQEMGLGDVNIKTIYGVFDGNDPRYVDEGITRTHGAYYPRSNYIELEMDNLWDTVKLENKNNRVMSKKEINLIDDYKKQIRSTLSHEMRHQWQYTTEEGKSILDDAKKYKRGETVEDYKKKYKNKTKKYWSDDFKSYWGRPHEVDARRTGKKYRSKKQYNKIIKNYRQKLEQEVSINETTRKKIEEINMRPKNRIIGHQFEKEPIDISSYRKFDNVEPIDWNIDTGNKSSINKYDVSKNTRYRNAKLNKGQKSLRPKSTMSGNNIDFDSIYNHSVPKKINKAPGPESYKPKIGDNIIDSESAERYVLKAIDEADPDLDIHSDTYYYESPNGHKITQSTPIDINDAGGRYFLDDPILTHEDVYRINSSFENLRMNYDDYEKAKQKLYELQDAYNNGADNLDEIYNMEKSVRYLEKKLADTRTQIYEDDFKYNSGDKRAYNINERTQNYIDKTDNVLKDYSETNNVPNNTTVDNNIKNNIKKIRGEKKGQSTGRGGKKKVVSGTGRINKNAIKSGPRKAPAIRQRVAKGKSSTLKAIGRNGKILNNMPRVKVPLSKKDIIKTAANLIVNEAVTDTANTIIKNVDEIAPKNVVKSPELKIKNETIEKLNKTKQMYEDILTDWTSASGDFNRQINTRTVGPHNIYTEGKQYLDNVEDLKNNYNVDDYVDGSYTMEQEVFKYSEGKGINGEDVLKIEGDLVDAPNAYASDLNKILEDAKQTMSPENYQKYKNNFNVEDALVKTDAGRVKLNRKKVVRNKAGLLDDLGKPGAIMTGLNILGAVGDYKDARRKGHGMISSVARAGVQFAVGEALGLWAIPVMAAKEVPGLVMKGAETLYKENRRMNSAANFQAFGDAQFQDTQQLATMRQSGMEMAKMAQYNLQQTLMGNEATYLHR